MTAWYGCGNRVYDEHCFCFHCYSVILLSYSRIYVGWTRCEMCSTPNPNPVFADPSQKTPPKPTTSWVCPNCTMENPVGVKRCQVCFADFPQSPEKSTPNSSNISRKDSLGTSLLMVSETSESEPEPGECVYLCRVLRVHICIVAGKGVLRLKKIVTIFLFLFSCFNCLHRCTVYHDISCKFVDPSPLVSSRRPSTSRVRLLCAAKTNPFNPMN